LGGLSEADIIDCLSSGYPARSDVKLGVGDDGAVLTPPPGRDLVSVLDTINEGVHFPVGTPAAAIAHRALAVNLSDLAAMGAEPAWASLSLSLPAADAAWLEDFARGFRQLADACGVALVGGDTVRGPLSVAVQLIGFVDPGRCLTRAGARTGDLVVISGTPGCAAAGLRLIDSTAAAAEPLRKAFLWPTPRLALGQALPGMASAAIDISDGLLTDLGRLLVASGVGATVDLERLPLAAAAVALLNEETALALACNGGDDYELCFTLPAAAAAELPTLASRGGCQLTSIGRITAGSALDCRLKGEPVAAPESGRWSHFDGEQT